MKKVTPVVIAITTMLFSCQQTSKKDLNAAEENLTKSKIELQEAKVNKNEALKLKEAEDWKYFKNEADTSIASMENDLRIMEIKIEKANQKEKQKLKAEYAKAKVDLAAMKEKLRQKNIEFEKNLNSFDKNVYEKNQSFKREFKHDMDEFGKSFKDLFKDNVK